MKDKIFVVLALATCASLGMVLAALLFAGATTSNATSFPLAFANDTQTGTILSATTNATGSGLHVEMPLHHTIHINAPSNFTVVTLDRSMDNSNWVPFSTNTLGSGVATVTEIVATGKWSHFRARVSGMTNSGTISVNYLGGR